MAFLVRGIALLSFCAAVVLADGEIERQGKTYKSSQAEKGYQQGDIERGWAFGEDSKIHPADTEAVDLKVAKGKRDVLSVLEEMLAVQKEQLKEQRKIRAILEEQYDPKPRVITKDDGSKCVANSSADCFDFPLIAEAKRVPVMANYLKNPHNQEAVSEYKKWLATYMNHVFDIGRATEYESAEFGSNTFKTDFKREGYDTSKGYFYIAKDKHNSRLVNALGGRGLSLKIYIGKTPDLDIYAMDQIAVFIKKHPSLPVELVFADRNSAEVYSGGARSLGFVGQAFGQKNVTKRVATAGEFPKTLQSTPAYGAEFKDSSRAKAKIIRSGKVESSKLAGLIVDWMIFEKIVDPAQLNDSRIWKDVEGYGPEFIRETYGKEIGSNGGKK